MRLSSCCKTGHHLICRLFSYSEARKAAAQAVKMSKERSWEEFSRRLDSNYSSANKALCQTICRLRGKTLSTKTSIKDSTGNILRDKKKILSLWKEYFQDFLNPVRATPNDINDTIDLEQEEVFTSTEVAQSYED